MRDLTLLIDDIDDEPVDELYDEGDGPTSHTRRRTWHDEAAE